MNRYLDFEDDIEIIDNKIKELDKDNYNFNNEKIKLLEKKIFAQSYIF